MTRVRYAQTPASKLLISGVRVALANDLFARRNNGALLLRLDDLAPQRPGPAAADQTIQDLRWFGIDWQTSFRQSERLALYQAATQRLISDGLLYPCFESEQELKAKQEFRRKRNQSPIYDRAMLSLTPKQRHDAEAGGKRPHWRFKLSGRTLRWNDLILGPREAGLSTVSDPILVRADSSPDALLASVVDDLDFGTTDIIHAEDSAGSTALQIELFEVLGAPRMPRFGQLPTISNDADSASRRAANPTLRALRNDGVEPGAIIAGLTGTAAPNDDPLTLDDLARRSDLADLAACRFDVTRMLRVNRHVLGKLDFSAVANRLAPGATEPFWLAVRGSLDLLTEARRWRDVVSGSIVPPAMQDARDLLLLALSLLPPEPWDSTVWASWTTALQRATARSGEPLLAPLRLALTGEPSGPDLAALLPLIGRPRAASRLAIAAA